MNNRGRQRELAVAARLQRDGFVTYRLAWGHADVLALKAGLLPMLVQVKSTSGGPYERFPPSERLALQHEAVMAGATAVLAWWPPRRPLQMIPATDWPARRP